MKKVVAPMLMIACLAVLAAPAQANPICYASQDCSGGGTVSCSGTSTCSVGTNAVMCDGNTVSCSPGPTACPDYLICPSPPYSQPFSVGNCWWATSVSCTATSMTCDGTTYSCDACESAYNYPSLSNPPCPY
jgi:hypothetical protein